MVGENLCALVSVEMWLMVCTCLNTEASLYFTLSEQASRT